MCARGLIRALARFVLDLLKEFWMSIMQTFQLLIHWVQENSSWLLVVAAWGQAFVTLITIPAVVFAAHRGARKAYQLNQRHELEKLNDQIGLLRFMLALEIQQNLEYLTKLSNRSDSWLLEVMPDLSQRFWNSQQMSYLLPRALRREEIDGVNRIYSKFELLSKIKNVWVEEKNSGKEESAETTINELDAILKDILEQGNPLGNDVQEQATEKLQKPSVKHLPSRLWARLKLKK